MNAHPLLRDRMEMLLRVVENAAGDVEKADEAERLVIEEIRNGQCCLAELGGEST